MALRMVQYDFPIAIGEALAAGKPYRMRFPDSCVLYLRDPKLTDRRLSVSLELSGGASATYEARLVEAASYGLDEIFEKGMLILLPFYIMRYEDELDAIERSEERTERLLSELSSLKALLEGATADRGRPLLHEQLVELVVMVLDHVLRKQEKLREKARSLMGGQVLELMTDRVAAAEERARAAESEARAARAEVHAAESKAESRIVNRLVAAGFDEDAVLAAIGRTPGASPS